MPEASLATTLFLKQASQKNSTLGLYEIVYPAFLFLEYFLFLCVSCACSVFDLHPMPAFYISVHHIHEAYMSVPCACSVYVCLCTVCMQCICASCA